MTLQLIFMSLFWKILPSAEDLKGKPLSGHATLLTPRCFSTHKTKALSLHKMRKRTRNREVLRVCVLFLRCIYPKIKEMISKKLSIGVWLLNPLAPNGHYSYRTAPLTSRRCILNIYSTNIRTEYFKHAA
jgi:hypothetical protein